MDTLQQQIEKTVKIAKRKYYYIYTNIFGIEDLYSDVNYLFALKLRGNPSENIVNFVLSALDSYITDRLRAEGPKDRNGKERYSRIVQESAIDFCVQDESYKATEMLTMIKIRAAKLDQKQLKILNMYMNGATGNEVAREFGISQPTAIVWKHKIFNYLKTGTSMPVTPVGEVKLSYGRIARVGKYTCDRCGKEYERIIAVQKRKPSFICSLKCRYKK